MTLTFRHVTLAILLTGVIGPLAGQFSVRARAPLRQNPFVELPLGAIQPEGWLREMLIRQKNGSTGNLDTLYPAVMGKRNGWRGGDGDQWERGPYWLDGLLPLAYLLHDKALIAKTTPFIEWTIKSQQPDGYFGPMRDYPPEAGLQRDNSHDWWPKMVMLKVLQQYYSATGDERVIRLMTNYFRYQLAHLPTEPLDHWSDWARARGGDNLLMVYWLYNLTGDHFLLLLADLLHRQTFDYTDAFLHTDRLSQPGTFHGVNLAQGIKEPLVYYQQHPEEKYVEATNKAFTDLTRFNGMAHGLFGADESLHGNDPTQGSELCTAVEMLYSLENLVQMTGKPDFADRLEHIAFNALPAQIDSDFISRQYFQQANQVMATRHYRNFDFNHDGTDVCYGLFTGYTCCTANMHQGWPKFAQNLWYATPDSGLAALIYAPNTVRARVAGGKRVEVREATNYPFEETISFTLNAAKAQPVADSDHRESLGRFPLTLRIPAWCRRASIWLNDVQAGESAGDTLIRIDREWHSGDVVELRLPMHLFTRTWHENAVSIERGPLTYALRIGEEVKKVHNKRDHPLYGDYKEVRPATPWNYGLIDRRGVSLENTFQVESRGRVAAYPWTLADAPVIIRTKAKRLPGWVLYNESTGPTPYSHIYNPQAGTKEEEITLVPYGCTKLRISEFPVIGN
jgi:DUF1680 family protein